MLKLQDFVDMVIDLSPLKVSMNNRTSTSCSSNGIVCDRLHRPVKMVGFANDLKCAKFYLDILCEACNEATPCEYQVTVFDNLDCDAAVYERMKCSTCRTSLCYWDNKEVRYLAPSFIEKPLETVLAGNTDRHSEC